jgi:hypothetical protein
VICGIPRSASAVADLVDENIATVKLNNRRRERGSQDEEIVKRQTDGGKAGVVDDALSGG